MTDSNRTSASTGIPTPVDDGTPAGHPTPAGEPPLTDQPDLFPGAQPEALQGCDHPPLLDAIGRLILAWGRLECATTDKVIAMRRSFGDVRAVGGRARPTMQKLLAELRALVAMRDRHDKQVLAVIAEIDGALQRTAQFRQIVMEGAQEVRDGLLLCRDIKNSPVAIPFEELAREAAQIERIRAQIAKL